MLSLRAEYDIAHCLYVVCRLAGDGTNAAACWLVSDVQSYFVRALHVKRRFAICNDSKIAKSKTNPNYT
jgi:hypothetical protein